MPNLFTLKTFLPSFFTGSKIKNFTKLFTNFSFINEIGFILTLSCIN